MPRRATQLSDKRFACYLRISKDPDGSQDATERQLSDCRKYADLKGIEITEVFEDVDLSAYRKGVVRPQYEAMLDGLANGEFGGVLVWKLDRLVRRTVEFARFWQVCEGAGTQLVSATQPIDTTDPVGMLVVHILVAFAEMESATTSARLKNKEAHLARQGRHKGAGRPAYGIKAGWTEIEPAEATRIQEAAERVLAGESVSSIIKEWNAEGVPSATGSHWTRRSLSRLLVQARLFAKREHLGEIVGDGTWPAILDEATGTRLRQLISYKSGHPGGEPAKRRYLLSGLLRCGKCGARMKAAMTVRGDHRYVCPSSADGGCRGTSIKLEDTDRAICEMVLYRLEVESIDVVYEMVRASPPGR